MLAIGCRRSNFSLTKSGKTKSYGLSRVSRTRFRRAGERRKRRGRCTNFLTNQEYQVDGGVASSRQERLSPRRPRLTRSHRNAALESRVSFALRSNVHASYENL